jgi:tRNA threonylcarbamoyladenosine biosynthesis protein TsaB
MLVLGLENSGSVCSCALLENDRLLSEVEIGHSEHSSLLPGLIDTVLAKSSRELEDIDLYAISIGPGSFTSLRVGLATFKAMAFFGRKSLVSVSTLDALAKDAGRSDRLICPLIDAKRGEVYYALYRLDGVQLRRLEGPEAIRLEAVVEKLNHATVFLGSGVGPGREILKRLGAKAICLDIVSPRASTICELGKTKFETSGGEEISALEPVYIKPCYAETKTRAQIERMRTEHLDEVVAIEAESFEHPWSREAFTWEVDSEVALPIVAMISAEVVGYLVVWLAYEEMHLGNISVAIQWRRKGIGEQLMRWLLRESRKRRVARLTLEVRVLNHPAIALYKKLGFREVALRKNYYPEGTDAYVMALELTQ